MDLYREKEELLFAIDEKSHEADLTEKGRNFVSPKDPDAFMLPDLNTLLHDVDAGPETDARKRLEAKTKLQADFEAKAQKIHAISQLLKAYSLYQLDVEYVVQENKVIIVDQHTGRLMPGRRWSDGLHQAVEAKEGVDIERETQTLATITIQNYFRLYQKLAGMTGTAETEAAEFFDIYKLGVLTIPTNKPNIRKDTHDSVYKTRREKFNAVVGEIKALHAQGRPDPRGHRFRRDERNAVADAEAGGIDPFRAQREVSPAGGRDRRARRASAAPSPSPRTWPVAARTSNSAQALPTWADCMCWARNATNRAGLTGSCAAAARARAIRVRRTFSSRSKTI